MTEELKPMSLRDALRDSPCPRPANGQPGDQNVGDCVDKGLCGCQNGEALAGAPAKGATPCSGTYLGYRDEHGREMHCAHAVCYSQTECIKGCISPTPKLDALPAQRQPVWLVEWPEDDNVPVRWWHCKNGWMRDANKATWFCRKDDAEGFINSHTMVQPVRATEHLFVSHPSVHAEREPDRELTPTRLVDDLLSACDPSNWDADRNKGDYFRGLNEAYEVIHELVNEYQAAMYEWTKSASYRSPAEAAPADRSAASGDGYDIVERLRLTAKWLSSGEPGRIVAISYADMDEAAAEIERLRRRSPAANETMPVSQDAATIAQTAHVIIDRLTREVDRLKAKIRSRSQPESATVVEFASHMARLLYNDATLDGCTNDEKQAWLEAAKALMTIFDVRRRLSVTSTNSRSGGDK